MKRLFDARPQDVIVLVRTFSNTNHVCRMDPPYDAGEAAKSLAGFLQGELQNIVGGITSSSNPS